MAKKAEKLGIEYVEYMMRYEATQQHDHPSLLIKRKSYYHPLRIDFQRHRLDYKDAFTMYGYTDVMEYRKAIGQQTHDLWDVGAAPYTFTYAPSLNHLRFDGYDHELEFLGDLKKELNKVEVPNLSLDPMTAIAQKLMKMGADVRFRYTGADGEFDSPFRLVEQYRNRTRIWAHSPDACRVVAEWELKRAQQMEESNQNKEVA